MTAMEAQISENNNLFKAGVYKPNRIEIWSIIKRELFGLKWVGNTTRQLTTPKESPRLVAGGGGVLPEKLGGGVRPAFQNPYPVYDQNLRYSLPYLWPDQKFETQFLTRPSHQNPVSDLHFN